GARRRQDARAVGSGARLQDVRGPRLPRLHGPRVRGVGRSGDRGAGLSPPAEGSGRPILRLMNPPCFTVSFVTGRPASRLGRTWRHTASARKSSFSPL